MLIATGALVGSSGAILSFTLCVRDEPLFHQRYCWWVRYRRLLNGRRSEAGEHREITAEETAEMLKNPHSVIITTPGYGWRWRRRSIRGGNHRKLRARYQRVFGIHPVAGRSPGI
ncbi:NAD(P)(+) transhydrogenase (Re/Si-specific) subunit beta [Salmonella enterica subsp. enterica]|nr:NAD(P)(+) transhydrogenase (Re/Si-specific) subunit beta [Salmonella enterica subsp. enterica]